MARRNIFDLDTEEKHENSRLWTGTNSIMVSDRNNVELEIRDHLDEIEEKFEKMGNPTKCIFDPKRVFPEKSLFGISDRIYFYEPYCQSKHPMTKDDFWTGMKEDD